MSNTSREQPIKKSLNLFLLLFLLFAAVIGAMLTVFYQMQTKAHTTQLQQEERVAVNLQLKLAQNHFDSIIRDLLFLSRQQGLQSYLNDQRAEHLRAVENEYLNFSVSKMIYHQVRYLSADGQEIVRVNCNAGKPSIVPAEGLQNKRQRYYFTDTFSLTQGKVFISPLDLNIEHGEVEIPYIPMIRFGAPIFDAAGNKRGIVLLNYMAQNLLDQIEDIGTSAVGEVMLVNEDGYWLKHPQASQEWGFMFSDRDHLRLGRQDAEAWNRLQADDSGQFQTAEGLYTFVTLSPLPETLAVQGMSDRYSWKLISFVSADALLAYSNGLLENMAGFSGGLFLVAGVVAWFLASSITRRRLYREQLVALAHFDPLTNMPNRSLFYDRFKQALAMAQRHGRQISLLCIDLDGFKQVNDRFGHAAGDELLIAAGERMQSCCRSSDTAARLGGDEFAILLTEVTGSDSGRRCAEKLLAEMRKPFLLKTGEVQIGASVGISLYPADGASVDDLLKTADQAMYRAKKGGKNAYSFATG